MLFPKSEISDRKTSVYLFDGRLLTNVRERVKHSALGAKQRRNGTFSFTARRATGDYRRRAGDSLRQQPVDAQARGFMIQACLQ